MGEPQDQILRLAKTTGNQNVGQAREASLIGTYDLPLPGSCRRGNDEVVGSTWRARPSNVRQQGGMRFGHVQVVGLDRNNVEDSRDETLALVPPTPFRQLNANLQLRHGDGRYRYIITVVDHIPQ